MNTLQVFNYNNNEVRTIQKNGEPWFVLKDVCEVFGETNYRRVSARLEDEEKGVSQIATPGGLQNMTVINEAGLYAALFAMQPEKARGVDAEYIEKRQQGLKAFKRWVTHEVLPTIHKHGAYMTPSTLEQLIADPDTTIKLLTALKEEQQARKALESKVEQDRPKVRYNMPTQRAMEMELFEVKESAIANPDGSVRVTRTTKVTGKGQTYFVNKFLGAVS